jgi:hypothetical protein
MRSLPQLLRSRSAEFWPVLRSLAAEELERLAGENCRLRKNFKTGGRRNERSRRWRAGEAGR